MRRSGASAAALTLAAVLAGTACVHRGPPVTPHGGPASAFAQLPSRLPEGTRVRVTTMNRRVEGSLAAIDRDGLTILSDRTTREAFSCAQIQRIDTRGDRPSNGAVIGAAIIALPAWNGCQNKGANASCVAIGIGAFAALGALIDGAHEGITTVYAASPGSCGTP